MIRFEKVTKKYAGPGRPALDQATIDIDKGEFVYLVGQSGSGLDLTSDLTPDENATENVTEEDGERDLADPPSGIRAGAADPEGHDER